MATTMIPTAVDNWQDLASCIGLDAELFFPERSDPSDAVRAACASCPVQWQCLEHAIVNRIDHGVWGGLTAPARRRISDRRTRLRRP